LSSSEELEEMSWKEDDDANKGLILMRIAFFEKELFGFTGWNMSGTILLFPITFSYFYFFAKIMLSQNNRRLRDVRF
jgi:hypothetical protein